MCYINRSSTQSSKKQHEPPNLVGWFPVIHVVLSDLVSRTTHFGTFETQSPCQPFVPDKGERNQVVILPSVK